MIEYPLVEVHWRDAQLHHTPTAPADFERTFTLAPRVTIGRLVFEAPTHLALASTIDEDGDVDGTWVIPRTWIESIWTINPKRTGVIK